MQVVPLTEAIVLKSCCISIVIICVISVLAKICESILLLLIFSENLMTCFYGCHFALGHKKQPVLIFIVQTFSLAIKNPHTCSVIVYLDLFYGIQLSRSIWCPLLPVL